MISDNEHDFPQKSKINNNNKSKYIKINKNFCLLTETHEVLLRLIKTPNIHAFNMAAPTKDDFLQTIDLEEAAMGWVLRLYELLYDCYTQWLCYEIIVSNDQYG